MVPLRFVVVPFLLCSTYLITCVAGFGSLSLGVFPARDAVSVDWGGR
jgi:hypothetical protein